MTKKTKVALASLLATSAIVPTMAVAAEESVTTTTTVEKTIDFKVEEETGMLARFVKGPGTLVEKNGQQYIQLNLDAATLNMVTAVKVGEAQGLFEFGGKKMVLIPVSNDYAAVEVTFSIKSSFVTGDFKATLTPDAASIKDKEEKPTEEVPDKVFTPGKEFGQIADGEYEITYDAYKTTDSSNKGNYKAITNHFEPKAALVVEDGYYYVVLQPTETSKSMLASLKVAGEEAVFDEESGVYVFAIDSISDLHEASVHVVAPEYNIDTVYPFGFAIETADLDLPEAEVEIEPVTMPLHVYQYGTNEHSIMQGKYTDDEVVVTVTEAGDFAIDVTFPQGQHLNDFTVKGGTVALKSEEVSGANTIKVYTVTVDNLTKIYTATADLTVRLNGTVLYDQSHDLQLQFGGLKNPFTDIMTAGNYGEIVELYSQGIFKEAAKFNPNNTVKRSQFALMLNRALELEVPATTAFTDIAKYDEETQKAIKALNAYGVINGTSTTTFAPGNEITRKNAALMIYRLLVKEGYEPTGAKNPFADTTKVDAEASKAIAELNELGIMTGSNGKFNPDKKLTRNQMAKVLNNAIYEIEFLK